MSASSVKLRESAPHHPHLQDTHRPSEYGHKPTGPMTIPNAQDGPPPPLPPPRYIPDLQGGHDTGWNFANGEDRFGYPKASNGHSRQGSHVLVCGSGEQGRLKERDQDRFRPDGAFSRRESAPQPTLGELRMSDGRRESLQEAGPTAALPGISGFSSSSEHHLSRKTVEDSSQKYDKQLLSKIGGPNTLSRTPSSSLFSSHSSESGSQHRGSIGQLNGQLKPLTVPERRFSHIDSPGSRRQSLLSAGPISPGQPGVSFRQPNFDQSSAESPSLRRFSTISSASSLYEDPVPLALRSQRGSYAEGFQPDPEFAADESGMRELNIHDRSPSGSDDYQTNSRPGQKRRASSPPIESGQDDRSSGTNALYHRRSAQRLGRRNSPVSRFQGSVSSAASYGQRSNSYTSSSYGLSIASSATSYSSERLSPSSAISPFQDSDYGTLNPHSATTARSLNPSPRGSISAPLHHQRTLSASEPVEGRKLSVDSVPPPRPNHIQRVPGAKLCDCCPKRPKKFETDEQLREHEQEKQYICQYCPKRFKNKNEAERHQNSLHLRRHSWSCAALTGMDAAFHESTNTPMHDVCGYCGEEFPSNPPNWAVRREHLNDIHKFGECNQTKKFFRADHFRQHLKHSHAGSSGKWTNQLETACMKDEPLPIPLSQQQQSPTVSGPIGPIGKERINSLGPMRSGMPPTKPDVINEAHEEC